MLERLEYLVVPLIVVKIHLVEFISRKDPVKLKI